MSSVPGRSLLTPGFAWRERSGAIDVLSNAVQASGGDKNDPALVAAVARFAEKEALRRLIEPVQAVTVELREEPMSRPVRLVADVGGIGLPLAGVWHQLTSCYVRGSDAQERKRKKAPIRADALAFGTLPGRASDFPSIGGR